MNRVQVAANYENYSLYTKCMQSVKKRTWIFFLECTTWETVIRIPLQIQHAPYRWLAGNLDRIVWYQYLFNIYMPKNVIKRANVSFFSLCKRNGNFHKCSAPMYYIFNHL